MTISLVLTIHDRTPEVSKLVADSFCLPGNTPDAAVIVLDRPSDEVGAGAVDAFNQLDCPVNFVGIHEPDPRWLSPVRAWNMGFASVETDYLYCVSSEVVQQAGNVERARHFLEDGRTVLHGKAECSCGPNGSEVNWGGTAPGNLLCDVAHPRPLGFIWGGPTADVLAIEGFDLEFMHGFWYDENDFFFRLWRKGLDFLFTDTVSGIHLHHDRPGLATAEGQAGIQRNADYMLKKHGRLDPFSAEERLSVWKDGNLRWRHAERS